MKRSLFLSLILLAAVALGGDRGGNGGDPLAGEFTARGFFLIQSLTSGADRGLLDAGQLARFAGAVDTTRVEMVSVRQPNGLWSIGADPVTPGRKRLQVHRAGFENAMRLHGELVRPVFQAYLAAAEIDDSRETLAGALRVTELDYQIRVRVATRCPGGAFAPVAIGIRIADSFSALRDAAYVNGVDYDPGDRTNYRHYLSERLCSARGYRFEIRLGDFSTALELSGGDRVTLDVPSGVVVRQ